MKARKTGKAINPEESNQSTERYFYSTSLLGLKNVFYCSTRESSEPFTKSSFIKRLPFQSFYHTLGQVRFFERIEKIL